jgi:hypothetical protein
MSLGVDNDFIFDKVNEFFKGKSTLRTLIVDSMGVDITIRNLYKITQNEVIAGQLFSPGYENCIFYNLSDAFTRMNNKSIIIKVVELGLYILFDDACKCISLLNRVFANAIPHDMRHYSLKNTRFKFSPQDVVFIDQSQYVVFRLIGNDEDAEEVKKCCKILFGKDINIEITDDITYKQFMLKMIVENFETVKNKVDELDRFMSKLKHNLSEKFEILKLKILEHGGKSYTVSLVCNDNYVGTKDKVLPDTVNYLRRNPNLDNNKVGRNEIKTEKKIKEELHDRIADKWVSDLISNGGLNSLDAPIYSHEIYLRYVKDNPIHISESKLCNVISKYGYENKRNREGRHVWYLNSVVSHK